ncbi:Uncharacterised protein [Legionella londiniensis]|nr:Uncharacterised protein [Legionella londiniensis]
MGRMRGLQAGEGVQFKFFSIFNKKDEDADVG